MNMFRIVHQCCSLLDIHVAQNHFTVGLLKVNLPLQRALAEFSKLHLLSCYPAIQTVEPL